MACVEKVLCMLACWVEDPYGDSFKIHLARPQIIYGLQKMELRYMQTAGSQQWDTSLAIQALTACNLTDEIGATLMKGHDFIKKSQCCLLSVMPPEIVGEKLNPNGYMILSNSYFPYRSLGEEFPNARIVEKVLVTLFERFGSKISSLEESRDLSQISLAELMNELQAQDQRRALRQENVIEDLQEEKLFVASCFSSQDSYNAWLIDSGCTHHMCHNATIFKDLDKTYNSTVKVGNGGYVDVKGMGTMKSKSFAINWENATEYAYAGVTQSVSDLWHKRFGHYNQRSLVELKKLELVEDMPNVSDEAQICEICQQGNTIKGHKKLGGHLSRCSLAINEQTSYVEVKDFEAWRRAMQEEMKMINNNETWQLVERPKNHKMIRVKWVFKTKLNLDGSICKYKARLVVRGYAQQYDVKSAFLNGFVDEEIYVEQSNGVVDLGKEDYVYLLRKALYGLKQALRACHDILFGKGSDAVMFKNFHMPTKVCYGYAKKIKMEDCKPVSTPMTTNEKLSKDDGSEKIGEGLYRSLIGSLLYLIASRPDILFDVSVLSRFMHSPSEKHFSVAKRVLRYIKGTIALGVQFSKFAEDDLKLLGYSNSDWRGCVDDSRITLGYLFSLGSCFFTWSSKKHETIAQSTAKSKYIVVASAINQALWLRKILKDFGQEQVEATNIMCDNISAVSILKNPVFHGRTKHIKIKYHFIREVQQSNEVLLVHCSSENQLTDIFTKPLPMERFEALKQKIGVCHPDAKEECSVVSIPDSKP
ncbi:Copia protein [Vitis vinifera]|uniref:Copia protein n=1 Tax=Vitis vinifera TaxID=29760 RepID=A0A438FJH8_VITVI|nr:Copia protein [Vitis vinifera]